MNPETAKRYDRSILGNYAKPSLTLVNGRGTQVWDENGRSYLDFTAGIAVSAIGHSHPRWVACVREQAGDLVHASNVFCNLPQVELAEQLCERAGPGKVMFCNSGTEANEALLKLARLHGAATSGKEGVRHKVICAEKAFHGRTFGSMAATPQEKIQRGFRPMLDGFAFGRLNDLDSFRRLVDETTAAIFLETIQGEGGIHAATGAFLQGIRDLCNEHGLLMILDEVQCGIGRTGRFFAFEHVGVQPDAIGMAKGLGGGFPIGAVWIADRYATLFTPGSHGCTFGGGPLAASAALATLAVIEEERLLEAVRERSAAWIAELESIAAEFPEHVAEVRGIGYLLALGLTSDPAPYAAALREHGILTVPAGDRALRLLPPLNVSREDLKTANSIVRRVLAGMPKPAARPSD